MEKSLSRNEKKSNLLSDFPASGDPSIEEVKEHLTNVLLLSSLALKIVNSDTRNKKITSKNMERNPFLKFIQRKDLSTEQIKSHLVKVSLANSLALSILIARRTPLNQLMEELIGIEYEVANYVSKSLQSHFELIKGQSSNGTLTTVLCLIPIGKPKGNMST